MNTFQKLQFIRDNVVVDDGGKYHLDICDKCQGITLYTSDYMNWDRKDGDFLYRCLDCNLKVCDKCSVECCAMEPTYCKDCKGDSDLIECTNCKRMCFYYCTNVYDERMEVDGVLCCRHCELDFYSD